MNQQKSLKTHSLPAEYHLIAYFAAYYQNI